MQYQGSKARIARELLPIILKDRKPEQWYIEPFAGGMNVVDKVTGNRIANDINTSLINFWKALQTGWLPPATIDKSTYLKLKVGNDPANPMTAWAALGCSFGGKWFAGYVNEYPATGRPDLKIKNLSYQTMALNGLVRQIKNLHNVKYVNLQYFEIEYPENSIIYCDPPYQGTTSYTNKFDHIKFWNWVRKMSLLGHEVYISEYAAPEDFTCLWQKNIKCAMNKNILQYKLEKLFTYGLTY